MCENKEVNLFEFCRICLNDGFDDYKERKCHVKQVADFKVGSYYVYNCEICGEYYLDGLAWHQMSITDKEYDRKIRVAVSHKFKTNTRKGKSKNNYIRGNDHLYSQFKDAKLPEIIKQLMNVILFIGEDCQILGGTLQRLPVDFHSIVGAQDRVAAIDHVKQLETEKFLIYESSNAKEPINIRLTINGLKTFERKEFE